MSTLSVILDGIIKLYIIDLRKVQWAIWAAFI
jgi:hypothetical protein